MRAGAPVGNKNAQGSGGFSNKLFLHTHPLMPNTHHLKDAYNNTIGTFDHPDKAQKFCDENGYCMIHRK